MLHISNNISLSTTVLCVVDQTFLSKQRVWPRETTNKYELFSTYSARPYQDQLDANDVRLRDVYEYQQFHPQGLSMSLFAIYCH